MTTPPKSTLRLLVPTLLALGLLTTAGAARANDFPTVDRVLYVQECMRANPGPNYEMVNKCSCALDAMAAEVRFDDYVTMSTAANATSIGGERGGYIRDNESLQTQIKRFRELQAKVKARCFIGTGPR
jgi:hypothetical protein